MSERDNLREVFFTAWQKYKNAKPLEPIEAQLIEIFIHHPEYHELLNSPEEYKNTEFDETNPFLHLSLHLAIREQLVNNKPEGIRDIYDTLLKKLHDQHHVEHKMMECLAQTLWEIQHGSVRDENYYIEKLRQI